MNTSRSNVYELGCKAESLPFSYLGILLGGNHRRISFWEPLVDEVQKKIDKLRNLTLSKGDSLTLSQSVIKVSPFIISQFSKLCLELSKR